MSENISKRLSFVLRHRPDSIGLRLDAAGWTDVEGLLAAFAQHGLRLSRAELEAVVATNDKKRFAFSADGNRIRAVQGHSVEVDLQHPVLVPPELLYHGTVERFLAAILREGLRPGRRHDVHLSPDPSTAQAVGERRGEAIILTVLAGAMHADGFSFRRADNGVWLTAEVPPRFLQREP